MDWQGLLNSFYFKSVFMVIIIVLGVSVGIKLGYSIVEERGTVTADLHQLRDVTNSIPLPFSYGQQFPAESCLLTDGRTVGFNELYALHDRTLFVFVDIGCDPCLNMLKYLVEIDETVELSQIVVCTDIELPRMPKNYRLYTQSFSTVKINRSTFELTYGIRTRPTVVGVDADGTILIQFVGFTDELSLLLVEQLRSFQFIS